MTDYMKEAFETWFKHQIWGNEDFKTCLSEAWQAALLAHIQRGVPDGDDGKRVLREVFALCEDTETKCSDETGDFARGRRFEAKGIARAIGAWYQEEFCGRAHMGEPAAPAPDHSGDATEMVAEPAEVPMPKPVAYGFGNTAITGHTNRLMMVRLDVPLDDQYAGAFWLPLVLADEARTYGERCRAAGESAGYARGVRGERDECAALCRNIYSWPGAYYAGPMDTATLKAAASAIEARSGPKVGKRAALRGEVKP